MAGKKTEYISIGKILPNPKNPRIIKDKKFKLMVKSIQDFPKMMAIRPMAVVKLKNGKYMVLGGNQRRKAIEEAKISKVPASWIVDVTHLTEAEREEFIIKDNESYGEYDYEALKGWDPIKLEEWGVDMPPPAAINGAMDDEYEMKGRIKTDIQPGDVFDIGPHRLICGDSSKMPDIIKLFDGQKCDLVVTDPPYNVSIQGGNHGDPNRKNGLRIQNDSMTSEQYFEFLKAFFTSQAAFTKLGGAWYVWHADSEGANVRRAFIESGMKLAECLIWLKDSIVRGRQDYHWKHEPCLYGWKEGAAHAWYSDRKQTTILEFERPKRNTEHPTMKPIPLIGYLIANSSKEGDIVADGFGGSGTTMVACQQLKRICYMAEIDARYCHIIIDRMQKSTPDIAILRNGIPYSLPNQLEK